MHGCGAHRGHERHHGRGVDATRQERPERNVGHQATLHGTGEALPHFTMHPGLLVRGRLWIHSDLGGPPVLHRQLLIAEAHPLPGHQHPHVLHQGAGCVHRLVTQMVHERHPVQAPGYQLRGEQGP